MSRVGLVQISVWIRLVMLMEEKQQQERELNILACSGLEKIKCFCLLALCLHRDVVEFRDKKLKASTAEC